MKEPALVVAAVCCALPLMVGAGIALGAVGRVVGSGAVLAAGAALAVWGWRRRRHAQGACEVDDPAERIRANADNR